MEMSLATSVPFRQQAIIIVFDPNIVDATRCATYSHDMIIGYHHRVLFLPAYFAIVL
jgi:hypothetical protein